MVLFLRNKVCPVVHTYIMTSVEYDFILLITSNSVDDNNVNFCLSDQYIFVMMYFGKLSPLTVVELNILHVHIW